MPMREKPEIEDASVSPRYPPLNRRLSSRCLSDGPENLARCSRNVEASYYPFGQSGLACLTSFDVNVHAIDFLARFEDEGGRKTFQIQAVNITLNSRDVPADSGGRHTV